MDSPNWCCFRPISYQTPCHLQYVVHSVVKLVFKPSIDSHYICRLKNLTTHLYGLFLYFQVSHRHMSCGIRHWHDSAKYSGLIILSSFFYHVLSLGRPLSLPLGAYNTVAWVAESIISQSPVSRSDFLLHWHLTCTLVSSPQLFIYL